MNAVHTTRPSSLRLAARTEPCDAQRFGSEPPRSLRCAYERSGGLIDGDALAGLLRARCAQPISVLAKAIVERRIVCIRAGGGLYLPFFQFGPCDAALWHATMQTLVPVLDDQELAAWCAEPNAWLQGARPCDALATRGAAVFEAARAHRFVAAGG